jgi:hypothetical protein
MLDGQEFSFVASSDCETLRFTIRGTTVSKMPKSGGPAGAGPHTYKVHLTNGEWDAVVAESGSTLTWVVTGTTSAGVTTRMVTTNDLQSAPMQFDLSMADAKLVFEDRGNGFFGSGSSSVAGDVNGDGKDDLLFGSYLNSDGGSRAGAAYLMLGPVTGTLDLSLAHAELVGEEPGDGAGAPSAGAGDVDGDGNDDLLIGSLGNGSTGAAYLVNGPVTGTLDLSLADAKLVGEDLSADGYDSYGAGCTVSGAGDTDADGHDDILVGMCTLFPGPDSSTSAYLMRGPITGTFDLGLAAAKLVPDAAWPQEVTMVSSAGDVDGDGLDDLLIGAPYDDQADTGAGAAYLVRGPVSGVVDLALEHTKLLGHGWYATAGSSVSGAGDIDGDGNDDVLIGSFYNQERDAGAVYVVLGPGPAAGDPAERLERVADATLRADRIAVSVTGAGDVDLDGHNDILVGALGWNTTEPVGAAYLVLSPVAGTMDLTRADVEFTRERRADEASYGVSAGDVDGDGRPDLLISAPWEVGAQQSAAYLIYGGRL